VAKKAAKKVVEEPVVETPAPSEGSDEDPAV
jgi:hypothetical protein